MLKTASRVGISEACWEPYITPVGVGLDIVDREHGMIAKFGIELRMLDYVEHGTGMSRRAYTTKRKSSHARSVGREPEKGKKGIGRNGGSMQLLG